MARADEDRSKGGEAGELAELEAYRARGLLGSPSLEGAAPSPILTAADRASLSDRFRCPECGGLALTFGARLVRHACPEGEPRPVAWRGYDGALVELRWWRPLEGKAP
jgi:hypothetical protein